MLTFNTKTGLKATTAEEIKRQVELDWQNVFGQDLNIDPASPAGQLIASETAIVAQKDSDVLFLSNQFNPITASGIWQDALAKIYFLSRQPATSTQVLCSCSGLSGTVIPQNSIVQTLDGLQLSSVSALTIQPNGSVTGYFQCIATGAIEIGANTVTKIITVIPGWDTVINVEPGITGQDEESQRSFELRRAKSVAKNARGTPSAIYGALADLEGVIDLIVLENTSSDPIATYGVTIPGHSVYVSVIGGVDSKIAQTMYEKKDAGCGTSGNTRVSYFPPNLGGIEYSYLIERPAPLNFGILITIKLTPSTPGDIETLIKRAVVDDFTGNGINPRVGMASTVYASRFYGTVVNAGAQELVSVKLCAPISESPTWVDEVTVNGDQAPALTTDNVFIIIAG